LESDIWEYAQAPHPIYFMVSENMQGKFYSVRLAKIHSFYNPKLIVFSLSIVYLVLRFLFIIFTKLSHPNGLKRILSPQPPTPSLRERPPR
jgi:hypothetical protein